MSNHGAKASVSGSFTHMKLGDPVEPARSRWIGAGVHWIVEATNGEADGDVGGNWELGIGNRNLGTR